MLRFQRRASRQNPPSHRTVIETKVTRGFTIVELLIVIVVIGILAAISIVAYNGIQGRAVVASLTSDLDNASKRLKLYQVDNSAYPTENDCSVSPAVNSICLKSGGSTVYPTLTVNNATNPQTFCLTATNGASNYYINQDSVPATGACAITNLSVNPSVETNTSGWAAYEAGASSSSLARDASQAYIGVASVKYSYLIVGTNAGYPRWMTGGTVLAQPIGTYVGTVFAKGPAGSYLMLNATGNSNGATLVSGPVVAMSPTEWRRITVTVKTTSVGNISAYLRPVGPDGSTLTGVVGDYSTDAVMIQNSPLVSAYADGSSVNWAWIGGANNSASTGPPL